MLKRLTLTLLLFAGLFGIGILIESQPIPLSSRPEAVHAATEEHAAVWVIDALNDGDEFEGPSRLVAMDAQSGALLTQLPASYGNDLISREARWRYVAQVVTQGESQHVFLTQLDVVRGTVSRILDLYNPHDQSATLYRDASAQLLVSPDERRVAVIVTATFGGRWYTRIFLVDPATGQSNTRVGWFLLDGIKPADPQTRPITWASFAGDGTKLLLLHSLPREGKASANTLNGWSTKLALLSSVEDRSVGMGLENFRDISDQFGVDMNPLTAALAPDGRELYLVQPTLDRGTPTGYRFAAFSVDGFKLVRRELVQASTPGARVPCMNRTRFTLTGEYLYALCYADAGHPSDFIQLLDVRTGLVSKEVPVPAFAKSQEQEEGQVRITITSHDKRQMYIAQAMPLEVAVFDVERQEIVRHAQVNENGAALDLRRGLEALLVNTASAKGPFLDLKAELSMDERRLYLTFQGSDERQSGIWVVDTRSLRLMGHWLKGRRVASIQLSREGGELYALEQSSHSLFALDALSGEVRRVLDKSLKQPFQFAGYGE